MKDTFLQILKSAGYKDTYDDGAHIWTLGKIEVVVTSNDQIIIFNGLSKVGCFDKFEDALKAINL
jgi:hypothetical protein